MRKIENPYIAVELQERSLAPVRRSLLARLAESGLNAEEPEGGAHISLGYGLGERTEEDLLLLARRLARLRLELKVKGIEVLRGLSTPFDYIVLALEENEAFRRARGQVESALTTKEMPGGFRAHVSLLRVPKGAAALDLACASRPLLERAAQAHCGGLSVCGERLAVFDGCHRCRIECRMTAAA